MNRIHVLVVDDQRLVREGIASLLKLQEDISRVEMAEDGVQGVEKALSLRPDVILMDIRMPRQDGIRSVELLREKNYQGKIIMLTTFDDEEYIVKSLRAGAVGYLMKDIPVEDLTRAVIQAHKGLFQMAPSVMEILMTSLPGTVSEMEGESIPDHSIALIRKLSVREREVFHYIGEGCTNQEIAELLFLSEGTVKNYVSGIFTSLGLRDRVQAALLAMRWNRLPG